MRPFRDSVTRLSLRQLRAQFAPKVFAALKEVQVQAGESMASVEVVSVHASSAHGGRRRWMLCPRCSRQTSVIGLVQDADGNETWACFRCARWKSRRIPRAARSAA